MNTDCYTKFILTIIAIGLFAIAFGRSSPSSAAAAPMAEEAHAANGDFVFLPDRNLGFVMINRRTGEVNCYEVQAPDNKEFKWVKPFPIGHISELAAPPAKAP